MERRGKTDGKKSTNDDEPPEFFPDLYAHEAPRVAGIFIGLSRFVSSAGWQKKDSHESVYTSFFGGSFFPPTECLPPTGEEGLSDFFTWPVLKIAQRDSPGLFFSRSCQGHL